VDPGRNLIWVKGSVQGPQGGHVIVRDARRTAHQELTQLPFPTALGAEWLEARQARPKKNAYDEYKT
jgi:hypothetical protein